MNRVNMIIYRGMPLVFGVAATLGDPTLLTDRRAFLKPALPGPEVPPAVTASVATLTITPRAALGGVAAGFDFSLSSVATRALLPGIYVTNVALGFAGEPAIILDPLFIQVRETTTDDVA